jgi:hypothetical protein
MPMRYRSRLMHAGVILVDVPYRAAGSAVAPIIRTVVWSRFFNTFAALLCQLHLQANLRYLVSSDRNSIKP